MTMSSAAECRMHRAVLNFLPNDEAAPEHGSHWSSVRGRKAVQFGRTQLPALSSSYTSLPIIGNGKSAIRMICDPRKFSVVGAGMSGQHRLVASSAENGRTAQYRRARTAVSLDNPGPTAEKSPTRKTTVAAPSDANRESKSAGRSRPDTVGPAEVLTPVDIPVAQRSLEERLLNPDRLSLDRRGLTACPLVQGEENLRLLNLQHNNIVQLRHLSALRKLIFLDLYDNRIERISGLGSLRALRVLMLGKNRIAYIEGLEALDHLDVLDLHSNEIEVVENLSHLSALRVLNLAGNRIRTVSGLSGMRALTELNLRRNRVKTIHDVDQLPNLEKLFLSHNDLSSWTQLESIGHCRSLLELTLDGNAVSREVHYRLAAIQLMSQVKSLDAKRVTDEERRLALAWSKREDDRRKELGRIAAIKEKRRAVISNAKRHWELSNATSQLWSRSGRVMRIPDLYSVHMGRSEGVLGTAMPEEAAASGEKAPGGSGGLEEVRTSGQKEAAEVREMIVEGLSDRGPKPSEKKLSFAREEEIPPFVPPEQPPQSDVEDPARPKNAAEIQGPDLILLGPSSFFALESAYIRDVAQGITGIVFDSVPFDDIFRNLGRLRVKYPNITGLTFKNTAIRNYGQLSKLSQIRRLETISIDEGNPVTNLRLWRPCLLAIMSHSNLKRINNLEITEADWSVAAEVFCHMESSAVSAAAVGRHPMCGAHPKLQNFKRTAAAVCKSLQNSSLSVDKNRTVLGQTWPQLLRKMIRRCVEEAMLTCDLENGPP